MRVGILTGGGDCASLNAAIRGFMASFLTYLPDAEVIGIEDGFLGLIERRTKHLDRSAYQGISLVGGTILGSCNTATPFSFQGKDVTQNVRQYYLELGLDCVVALGGDGTMSICHGLSKKGMNFIGIPKTIDNDLMQTDRTFGFDTAISIATEALDRLRTTARSHRRVMILETMGRYAGWIALYAGVASEANIVLLPEFPYEIDEVIAVTNSHLNGNKYCLIVIAEGSYPKSGQRQVSMNLSGSPDPIRLGGIGKYLQYQMERYVHSEIRTTALGHTQRGGQPTAFDRLFATNLGCYAAKLAANKQYGNMVCVKNNLLTYVSLEKVANKTRTLTLDDMTLFSAVSTGISLGIKNQTKLLNKLLKKRHKIR